MEKRNGMHDGHKRRIRKKFLRVGSLDGYYDHEMLELYLSFANPRNDTNGTAHELLSEYKTIDKVLDAPYEDLVKIPGVGERLATYIVMFRSLFKVYALRQAAGGRSDEESEREKLYGQINAMFTGEQDTEMFYMFPVSATGQMLDSILIGKGSINEVFFEPRQMVKAVMDCNATEVIFAHNHPSGTLVASQHDVETSIEIEKYFKFINVRITDHLICSDGRYISIKDDPRYTLLKKHG